MFTKKDYKLFFISMLLISVGYLCMVVDPKANGFGMLTLGIAPPLLLLGFFLPIAGIIGIQQVVQYFAIGSLKKINQWKFAFGLTAFLISFIMYLTTLEPTASLWDCSEFIAAAYKLEVPHTPGTPLSLLFGRIFTIISFGEASKVAWSINVMSAFFSALSVLLVYDIIYYVGERAMNQPIKNKNSFLIIAALSGSLCLAFSDTFWFSAVEAETYGIACFFLLLIVSLIIKVKGLKDSSRQRQLILIFYVSGLSYCIHPMCLLALAILPFEWIIQSGKLTFTKLFFSFLAGLVIVLAINRMVAVGLFELAFFFDLFFVNKIHLPFYSGAILLMVLLVIAFAFLVKKYPRFSSYTWAVIFLVLGFTPYMMLFIRSNHNPPIDETNPENLAMIKAYMNRESYGSRPLLYGPYFDAEIDAVAYNKEMYFKNETRYDVGGILPTYQYEKNRNTILPRIYSNDQDHIRSYRLWTGLEDHEKPGFTHNLKFMFSYQLGHMYLRYFMWNFSGRESDRQNSRWLTPWDGFLSSDGYNKAHNQYWMLPLALGIFGLFYQYKKNRKDFFSISIFFLVTGLVLALYLNSTPNEPRERDYIYIGSYIAWCIWIGMGTIALFNVGSTVRIVRYSIAFICLGTPAWMLYQNYDDHNRSGRTFQIDNARNTLSSCAANSILFTGGDNDTFPLWYIQEVEKFRTDVRVVVLSYFNTDWYINQLRKGYYDSKPFKLTLNHKNYRQYGLNDVLYVQETIKGGIDLKKFLQLLKEEHAGLTMRTSNGDSYNIVPSKTLKVSIEEKSLAKEKLQATSISADNVSREITLLIKGNHLPKNALAFLDILASNNWERPMYFNFTSLNTIDLDLSDYVVQEGSLYRLTPIKNNENNIRVDTETSRINMLEKADYGNLSVNGIYFNYEDYHARTISPLRESFNILAVAYMNDGNLAKAEEVLLFAMAHLYANHLRPSFSNLQAAEIFLSLNKKDLAQSLCVSLFDFHYKQLQANLKANEEADRLDLYLSNQSAELLSRIGDEQYLNKMNALAVR
jgi:hypothetical protein